MKLRSPKGEGALALEELDGHVAGLVALVGRSTLSGPRFGVGGLVDRIVRTFGAQNVCVEVQRHLLRDEEADNQALLDLASAFHVPVIATNGVRFAEPAEPAVVRRAHLHPAQNDAGARRPASRRGMPSDI